VCVILLYRNRHVVNYEFHSSIHSWKVIAQIPTGKVLAATELAPLGCGMSVMNMCAEGEKVIDLEHTYMKYKSSSVVNYTGPLAA